MGKQVYDLNLISYSSQQGTIRSLHKLPNDPDFRSQAIQEYCNDYDLKPDEEKRLFTVKNPRFSELNQLIAGRKKDFRELAKIHRDLNVGILPGDFFDSNDGFPILTQKSSRLRLYYTSDWKFVRLEFTPDIYELFTFIHIPVSAKL